MDEHLHNDLRKLRQQLANAEYQVDSQAVAAAIVRRRWAVAVAPKPAQTRVIASPRWDGFQALAA